MLEHKENTKRKNLRQLRSATFPPQSLLILFDLVSIVLYKPAVLDYNDRFFEFGSTSASLLRNALVLNPTETNEKREIARTYRKQSRCSFLLSHFETIVK